MIYGMGFEVVYQGKGLGLDVGMDRRLVSVFQD